MPKFRPMSLKTRQTVEDEIWLLLHAHRDALRNRGEDTTKIYFNVTEGFYGEAFGVMRGLAVLNFGYLGSDSLSAVEEGKSDVPEHNLKWWFDQIGQRVLQAEGWRGDNECDWCYEKYGKDAVRGQSEPVCDRRAGVP